MRPWPQGDQTRRFRGLVFYLLIKEASSVKYKEAIVDKKNEIEDMVAKVKEIPIAEVLGKEAQTLKTDAKNLENTLTELTTRFQVYYDALKEKGGSLSGLELLQMSSTSA